MLLDIQDLRIRYGKIEVVKGVSLGVEARDIVTLIGANGAGKSTIIKAISGLIKPFSGNIIFNKKQINGLKTTQIVGSGIAQVPEGGRVFSKLTVEENLRAGTYLRKDKDKVEQDYERVYRHFPVLLKRGKQKASTMSGGERQMLAFGRALMNGPKLLTCDEPSLGLAPLMVKTIFEIIRAINEEGVTILLVEQNARMALEIASRAYVLETGKVVIEGDSKNLMHSQEVRKSYLGG